jgi:hypothetical protein
MDDEGTIKLQRATRTAMRVGHTPSTSPPPSPGADNRQPATGLRATVASGSPLADLAPRAKRSASPDDGPAQKRRREASPSQQLAADAPGWDTNALPALQAAARGRQLRQHVMLEDVADGWTSVTVQGDKKTFDQTPFHRFDSGFPKVLNYDSFDPSKYELNVVGGDRMYGVKDASSEQFATQLFGGTHLEASPHHLLLTGSYHNSNQAVSDQHPEHAAIGAIRTLKDAQPVQLPPPPDYADQYSSLELGKTRLPVAPELSRQGQPKVTSDMLLLERFQYDIFKLTPGTLFHLSDPNPRSGVSVPQGIGDGANTLPAPPPQEPGTGARQDAIRTFSFTSKGRGPKGTGVRGDEAGWVGAALDRMNVHPGRTVNTDGGGPMVKLRLEPGKPAKAVLKGHVWTGAPNFVAVSRKPDRTAPGEGAAEGSASS